MPLESMTGFARDQSSANGASIVWELKSVNGKTLDVRLRLPAGWERIEQAARQKFQSQIQRGNIQAGLSVDEGPAASRPKLNDAFLAQIEALAGQLSKRMTLAAPSIADLLSVKGVLEQSEAVSIELLEPSVMQGLERAVRLLKQSRQGEGAALESILRGQVAAIETLAAQAEADPSRQPEAVKKRIADTISLLTGASPALDESRLAAEALFAASRADIREELDRLKAHAKNTSQLLAEGGAIGRKLDFLAQEFNREANTLCSKSNAASITSVGLELKSVVDQFREQVQNLE